MNLICGWFQRQGILVGSAIAFSANGAIAQIIPDTTLPSNSQVSTQDKITTIQGGTPSGSNLFHSFEQFSVSKGSTAHFKLQNPTETQNIITRVTGKSISNIEGILKADGTANLFLINPNGIIFGSNASLDIKGSFIASTASSLNFADGTKFSAIDPQTTPLLTVSTPIGLQFGATAASIRNQSQAPSRDETTNIFGQPVGLQVQPGKTLALVGGDITLQSGNLTAASGRIELGSVASNSLVSLKSMNQGWILGYESVQNFQNIQLMQDSFAIPSVVDVSGEGGGSIQLQGNTVKLSGDFVRLISLTTNNGDGKDITINSRNLIVQDGAQVVASTLNKGSGGNLIVNASESVELTGSYSSPGTTPASITSLFTATFSDGDAGNLTINTKRLRVQNGAEISAGASGITGDSRVRPSEGKGGNLTVNASESVELIGTWAIDNSRASSLFASAIKYGNAGTINVTTGRLIIRDGAVISANVQIPPDTIFSNDITNTDTPGQINLTARSILLDNGQITSNSESGKGGNIRLQVRDLLSMRRNSKISTNSGKLGTGGDGGNITIDAPNGLVFAAPLENNDITANAFFGSGGKITINADSIFGFVQRDRTDFPTQDPEELDPKNLPTNDITAFSQQNPSLSGVVEINSPDVDPSKGLVELPVNAVDAQDKIVAGCNSAQRIAKASFITTGRGGIASSPTDALISDAVLTDWIVLEGQDENRAASVHNRPVTPNQSNALKINSVNSPTQIVEAQGWVMDSNGNVVLVAQAPTVTPHSSTLNPASCAVN
ncbi:filamentous hemagglutinin N-terminal domain-containing protein [Nostoc sp. UHCC 0702]|nr:filamentous hemagglutinin N-terminal domain-containing protein [Nostoc sp. UHCC 0702]